MKHILVSCWLALAAAGLVNATPAMDDNGHVLKQLWAQYESAQKADRPQKQAEILTQIKEEARKQHLPVDFYDAATQYVDVVARRNWKDREPAEKALAEEVKAFDEPIVTFRWMQKRSNTSYDALWAYVKAHADGFSGRTPAFYTDVSRFLGGALPRFIRNDKEYVLWSLLGSRSTSRDKETISQELEKELGGRYPAAAALDYYQVTSRYWSVADEPEERKALEEVAARYAGKAASLYPRADLLAMDKARLDREKGGEQAYKAVYAGAQALEKERQAYTGDEALVAQGCTRAASLAETLTDKALDLQLKERVISVIFRNLDKAEVKLYRDDPDGPSVTVKTWKVRNQTGSFYVQDTVRLDLPVLSDGSYTLEAVNGKLSAMAQYEQYTLSLAVRKDGRGWCAYVADYKTGEPLGKASLTLLQSGSKKAESSLTFKGFTPLPSKMQKILGGDDYYRLRAASGTRLSKDLSLYSYDGYSPDTSPRCLIYRDRGAYNPGDTLQYMALLYEGNPMEKLSVMDGRKLSVVLYDEENEEIARQDVTTGSLGSASGSFVLPKGLRNGMFHLRVSGPDGVGASDYFRVDEFVLPTFDLSFDPVEKLYLAGDEVPVSGTLSSYSGHSLAGARINIKVSYYDKVVLEQEVPVEEGDTFHTTFPSQEGYHYVEVTVTEATGETHSFNRTLYVGSYIQVLIGLEDIADGGFVLDADEPSYHYRGWGEPSRYLVEGDQLRVRLRAADARGNILPLPLTYSLTRMGDEEPVHNGSVLSGDILDLSMEGLPSGLYTLVSSCSVKHGDKVVKDQEQCRILVLRSGDKKLASPVKRLFLSGPSVVADGDPIRARVGSAQGNAYVVLTVYGKDREVLETKQFTVKNGTVEDLAIPYRDAWPDAVRLQLFYFMDGEAIRYDRQYRREKEHISMPLQFSRFHDKAYPGTSYTFTLKTDPGAELLVAAWDKSLDAISANYWPVVSMQDFSVPGVSVNSVCGNVGEGGGRYIAYGAPGRMLSKAAVANGMVEEAVLAAPMARMDDAMEEADSMTAQESADVEAEPVSVRSVFSSALTFQPHLRPSADGTLDVTFSTSDKLSTYYVAVYAHDAAMHNAFLQKEMLVSLPVKVALAEPQYLYEGDSYEVALTVSSITEEPVPGTLRLVADGVVVGSYTVVAEPGKTLTKRFPVKATAVGEMVLTGFFQAADFSDALRVKVPVYASRQTLTEAHSAVLHAGESREALLADLRSRFVNIPGSAATLREITVLDMVKDAIPSHVEPSGKDVLSLSEAWYVRLMASRLGGMDTTAVVPTPELVEQIMACRNADGGFGWFEGMDSSPIITAVVMERVAKLRDHGFEVPDLSSSARYLDKTHFSATLPCWRGWLSDAQYMHVRALYSEVPFAWKAVTKTEKKMLADFTKNAQAYLVPTKSAGRGLQGQILSKSRRILTLKHLRERSGGLELASAWGVSFAAKTRLENSMKADISSLLEYAVEHRDGGWYYPNAVMPWRGLLESEAYAHSLLCDLLWMIASEKKAASTAEVASAAKIADGIRLWLMLQKETQKWDEDPAFVDAVTSILDGSEAVLQTRVLALSGSYEAPFEQIKAAGNGFTIDRTFYREKAGSNELEVIKPGTPVQVGDKIVVKYEIWNGENRSFVKVDAGREASLRPVQQLSGRIGYGFIVPFRRGYVWSFTPQGYRNVKAAHTEYFFDSYPEEKTTLKEEFFVTQAGSFVAPVVTIESLYAPHYRANSAYREALTSNP